MDLHEIYEEAKRVTKVYAQGVQAGSDLPRAIVPGRVYVLLLNNTILGCFAVRQQAYDEAHALMHHYGGTWHALSDQIWSDDHNRLITVSAHDVR